MSKFEAAIMEQIAEENRWPAYDLSSIDAMFYSGLRLRKNFYVRCDSDVGTINIGKVRIGMFIDRVETIDAWVHEFTEIVLIDLMYQMHLFRKFVTIKSFDDEFDIQIPHLLASLFTQSSLLTRGRREILTPEEFADFVFMDGRW